VSIIRPDVIMFIVFGVLILGVPALVILGYVLAFVFVLLSGIYDGLGFLLSFIVPKAVLAGISGFFYGMAKVIMGSIGYISPTAKTAIASLFS